MIYILYLQIQLLFLLYFSLTDTALYVLYYLIQHVEEEQVYTYGMYTNLSHN